MQSQGACDNSILSESIDGLRAGAGARETSDLIDISYQAWQVPLESACFNYYLSQWFGSVLTQIKVQVRGIDIVVDS